MLAWCCLPWFSKVPIRCSNGATVFLTCFFVAQPVVINPAARIPAVPYAANLDK